MVAAGEDEDATPEPAGGYVCPYCAVPAPSDSWHTQAQVAMAEAIVMREVVQPEIDKLSRSARKMSGGLIELSVESDLPEIPDENAEDDGMRRVDFPCHPEEPVKVDAAWTRSVHCLLCGSSV